VVIFAAKSWSLLSRHFMIQETVSLFTATLHFYKILSFLLCWNNHVFQVSLWQKSLCHAISVKSQISSKFGWSTIKVRFVLYIHTHTHTHTYTYSFHQSSLCINFIWIWDISLNIRQHKTQKKHSQDRSVKQNRKHIQNSNPKYYSRWSFTMEQLHA
jgi:hypothetical protein